jgi:putative hydrolase of the HAD superfamily
MKDNRPHINDIVFDLGNVLVPFDWNRALTRLRPRLPLRFANMLAHDEKSFRQIFLQHGLELETGRMDFQTFWGLTTGEIGLNMTLGEFRDVWCDIFDVQESVVSLAERLTRKYGVWLASNTCREHFEWIQERFPRIGFFRGAALSYELGIMKPSREYYEKALELFGIEPLGSVFIDDIPDNVEGARLVGMRGIVFRGYGDLVKALDGLGVSTG